MKKLEYYLNEGNTEEKIAGVIGLGMINITTGMTDHGWSIYENGEGYIWLIDRNLLYSSNKSDFAVGDLVKIVDSQNGRKLQSASKIQDVSVCKYEDVIEMLLRNKYDYRKLRAFTKKKYSNKLSVGYSVKYIK